MYRVLLKLLVQAISTPATTALVENAIHHHRQLRDKAKIESLAVHADPIGTLVSTKTEGEVRSVELELLVPDNVTRTTLVTRIFEAFADDASHVRNVKVERGSKR